MSEFKNKLLALSDTDLALIVKVAFEGINDGDARTMIGGIVEMSDAKLQAFGETVVEPLVSDAETTLGWYGNIAAN